MKDTSFPMPPGCGTKRKGDGKGKNRSKSPDRSTSPGRGRIENGKYIPVKQIEFFDYFKNLQYSVIQEIDEEIKWAE